MHRVIIENVRLIAAPDQRALIINGKYHFFSGFKIIGNYVTFHFRIDKNIGKA